MLAVAERAPTALMWLYGVCNVLLNLLNTIWFVKIAQAIWGALGASSTKTKTKVA